ncbi:MAG: hypothetical protein ACTS6G_01885 [Candidatus Hodgkinia cicadicola]
MFQWARSHVGGGPIANGSRLPPDAMGVGALRGVLVNKFPFEARDERDGRKVSHVSAHE